MEEPHGPEGRVHQAGAGTGVELDGLDEEHDASYKQDGDPRYDARHVAAYRAYQSGARLVAGSATPRPETVHAMHRLRLPSRVEAKKPLVVRLDGNSVDAGRAILAELNHPLVTLVDTMDGAADKAAELANA